MSLETWKQEFYPINAREVSKDDAIQHSLTKWRGLRPEALARHGVVMKGKSVAEAGNEERSLDAIFIDAHTCALCHHYEGAYGECLECPLFNHLGERCDEYEASPYKRFSLYNNPEPMIKALEATLKAQEADDESQG